jgi:hypothetical protein
MPSQTDDVAQLKAEVVQLEAEVAELRALVAPRAQRHPRPRLLRRLALIGLVVALAIPAGVVLANHQFSDVPTGSSIHDDVEALVEAGVTTGCGGGKYCPTDAVTRGQMAQFLNRLGALDGQAPSVNADRVDGKHASSLIRVASWQTSSTMSVPISGDLTEYGSQLVITAPAAGFVTINIGVTFRNSTCTAVCLVTARVHHLESIWTLPGITTPDGTETYEAVGVHGVFAVDPGVNHFDVQVSRSSVGNGIIQAYLGSGTAVFSPFGSTGGSTLGTTVLDGGGVVLEP